jgi:hypothetical protein
LGSFHGRLRHALGLIELARGQEHAVGQVVVVGIERLAIGDGRGHFGLGRLLGLSLRDVARGRLSPRQTPDRLRSHTAQAEFAHLFAQGQAARTVEEHTPRASHGSVSETRRFRCRSACASCLFVGRLADSRRSTYFAAISGLLAASASLVR